MTIKERIDQISKLQELDTPWDVRRFFGKIVLFGDQINMAEVDSADYADAEEFKQALQWLVEQMGGKVKWSKSKSSDTP